MIEPGLERALIDLLREAKKYSVKFVLAGGLGVLLRVRLAQVLDKPTLAAPPVARTTHDLDLLLSPEVVVDAGHMERFRGVLDQLGYREVETARYYQFVGGADGFDVKVDLHAEPPVAGVGMKIDERRIRPRGYNRLHARRLDEALGSALYPVPIAMNDEGEVVPAGTTEVVEVLTPNLFSYSAMKLVALRDNLHNAGSDYGRRHAYDLFTLWACATERIWEDAMAVREATRLASLRAEFADISTQLFDDGDSIGSIRLREALRQEGASVTEEDRRRFGRDILALMAC